jgi:hypothetical protein
MMNIRKLLLLLLMVCTGLGGSLAFAEELCEKFDPEPRHFKSLYEQSKKLGKEICLSYGAKINSTGITQQFAVFANQAAQQVETKFAGKSFLDDLLIQMQHFSDLAQRGVDKATLPTFEVRDDTANLDSTKIIFQFKSWDVEGTANSAAAECTQEGLATCRELLDSLATAIEQYKKPYVHFSGKKLSERASILSAEWDRYFETARSQTLWDALLTTYMEQDYLAQSRLVGPMQKQWFLIHPSIVIENVSAAVDGDELSGALAIEWIGINWWDENSSPIGYPIGISLASTYSDRVSVDDIGHGLMFHFDNSFSVGWADRDGDAGIYVTVDFLNLMTKRKQRWEDYREKIESIANEIENTTHAN